MKAFAELSEDGKRIEVYFPYNKVLKDEVKNAGGRFVEANRDKGIRPHWTLPLEIESGKALRNIFGLGLKLGDALRAWGKEEQKMRRNLGALASANDADLKVLPEANPLIAAAIAGDALPELGLPKRHPFSRKRAARPYQRADIAMMAIANVLNANQPGTGKTLECIGAWYEGGFIDAGPHLVIAPVKALEATWEFELEMWTELDVYTAEDTALRKLMAEEALDRAEQGEPVVLVINPDMLRITKYPPPPEEPENEEDDLPWQIAQDKWEAKYGHLEHARKDMKGNLYAYKSDLQKRILNCQWQTVTIDEFHKFGLPNPQSLFSLAVMMLKANRKTAMSGTPMGGKARRLWGTLHWLEPEKFSSFWRWAQMWLEVDDNGYGKKVKGLQQAKGDEFYEAHAHHLVRRLKREALPGLPAKAEIIVNCNMTPAQKKQYIKFEADLEIRIDEERLSATNVLSEYARLKQFANASQEMRDGRPFPTQNSGKLEALVEKLDEEGIRKTDYEPSARAIIASESKRFVDMVADYLSELYGDVVIVHKLTGDTKDSKPIIKDFRNTDDETPVIIVMTIQTGGVSLNLEEAQSMHAMDETWNPDDMEQFFDRGDRGSRTEPLRCYTYRTKKTIQEDIAMLLEGKILTNKNVLDLHRERAAKIKGPYAGAT